MNKFISLQFKALFLVLLCVVEVIPRPVPLNGDAGNQILYETQVRVANACKPGVGSKEQIEACNNKIAPRITYKANLTCDIIDDLLSIKLGTIDDLLEPTTDFQQGITLSYIKKKVGATAVWLMPMFPNNDRWSIPDACDNLGSPYAVRDFYHLRGTLSRRCILLGQDEETPTPCYGNQEFDDLVSQANTLGLKIFLDLPFNHLGHNFMFYDTWNVTTIRDRVTVGQNLDNLWNFDATYDPALLHPVIRDDALEFGLTARDPDFKNFVRQCPGVPKSKIIKAFNMWRESFDYERSNFNCNADFLEQNLFGFYLGSDSFSPSSGPTSFFTNNWLDVKFLFNREDNVLHKFEYARVREYLFRVMNYWVSRGVQGFRLDHTTDPNSGISPNEWLYITTKVNYYAAKRGQPRPIYLAEEFHEQMSMGQVVDIETEGYVGDICGRGVTVKDTSFIERVTQNYLRFNYQTFVMTALETHDEKRLLDGTGYDIWTGSGMWAIGATIWSTPMLLMGQEFGESWGVGFKRNDFLRARFVGTQNYNPSGESLVDFYGKVTRARLNPKNKALQSQSYFHLRTQNGNAVDDRIFAKIKWWDSSVVLVFHNLWNQPSVEQTYFIPAEVGTSAGINDGQRYRFIDILLETPISECQTGADLKWSFHVKLTSATVQWLRLEAC